jgi:hypothetical protein
MLELIEKGIYSDFIFLWDDSLDNPKWMLREHFTEVDKIDNNLRSWDRKTTGLFITTLLQQFESP